MATSLKGKTFFGEIDRVGEKEDGQVRATLPAWYFKRQIEELDEQIAKNERQIKMGLVGANTMAALNREIKMARNKKSQIIKSKITLTDQQKDRLWKFYKWASIAIREKMPSRTDMMKGLVDPHIELKKQKTPCITVNEWYDICASMEQRPGKDQKISLDQLVICWKIAGSYLDQVTNTEHLRSDEATGVFKSERSLEELDKSVGNIAS